MSSNSDLFLLKNDEEEMRNFEIVKIHTLKFQTESTENLSGISNNDSEDKKEENNDYHKKIEECKHGDSESRTPSASSEEEKIKEEDGFRTPTSLNHKISVAIKCPAAPRKTKPSLKRRTPYNYCRHPLDLSKEVELLFPIQHIPSSESYQSRKKLRREEPQ